MSEELLTGWGRTSPTRSNVARPASEGGLTALLAQGSPRGLIARGLGRSYGDVAQNAGGVVADVTALDHIGEVDPDTGLLTVGAGASLQEIIRTQLPKGWFLPVTPGTRFVTVGGAIANDIHGKNHHREGSFADHVASFEMIVPASGGRQTVTPDGDHSETFRASAGGLGLTGVITQATIRMLRVQTSRMRVDTERAANLDDLMARMESGDHLYRYSVAWIDCLARGARLGRSVLTRGDHAVLDELSSSDRAKPLAVNLRTPLSVPPGVPPLINGLTTRLFNEMWFRKAPTEERDRVEPLVPFFYPLDAVRSWNRVYGRRGFVQYQYVVPFGREDVVRATLERLSGAGCPSFLAVLKRFGDGGRFLSFPIAGWTLAVDVPAGFPGLEPLLDGIDEVVAEAGGRVYLAKDSRLRPELLAQMYPELDSWREIRSRLDPNGLLRSDLDRRLGVSEAVRPVGSRKVVVA
jgi:decaprenylphospho-beta-D-ribofuranose 2-oxidase